MQIDRQIHLLSGLGADRRAFQSLKLDFSESVNHIEWINPVEKESLELYSKRIIAKNEIKENAIVIGLSFGGIVAAEISKQVKLSKAIIISSARNRYDLPVFYRLFGKIGIIKLIPKKVFGKSNFFVEKAFGVKTEKEKKLLRTILNDTDTYFAKWAISEISNWAETNGNESIIRIHGSEDNIIPLKNHANYLIEKGTHFMIVQRASEISEILNKELNKDNL